MIGTLLAGFAGLGADQDHQRGMYLPALTAHPGFQLVAVCPSGEADRDTAARTAAELDVPLYPELDKAMQEHDVELVVVAAPLEQRTAAITSALQAGKHVLADKPLAATSDEVAQLVRTARDAGVVLLPAHHHRWNPALRSVAAVVASGRVGLPWNVQADFLVAGGTPVPLGELINFAVYPVDVLRCLLGLPAVRVSAISRNYWRHDVEDYATLLIDYERGVTATIILGRTGPMRDIPAAGMLRHRYRISGSHGVLVADALKPGLAVRTGSASATAWTGGGTIASLVANLHQAITTSGLSPIDPADVLDVYRVVDAARRSARSGGRPYEIQGADR